jgi:hypothetical protein
MTRHRFYRERDEERQYQRYLEWRDQQREDEDDDYYDPNEDQPIVPLDPKDHISFLLTVCKGGTRESRLVGFAALFEYILSVPEFVNAHANFREVAVNKAREVCGEPSLRDLCARIVSAYTPRG